MTRNINEEPLVPNWNEYILNLLTSINWRASLVPAAAVIPAPIAYTKVAAVKKLVVEFLVQCRASQKERRGAVPSSRGRPRH